MHGDYSILKKVDSFRVKNAKRTTRVYNTENKEMFFNSKLIDYEYEDLELAGESSW